MTNFRITSLVGGFGNTNPPAIVPAVFPAFDGWPVTLTETECLVTAPDGTTPVDLGPLVKVEQIQAD